MSETPSIPVPVAGYHDQGPNRATFNVGVEGNAMSDADREAIREQAKDTNIDGVQRVSSKPATDSWQSTARDAQSGRRLALNEITDDSIVKVNGVEAKVRDLVSAGLLPTDYKSAQASAEGNAPAVNASNTSANAANTSANTVATEDAVPLNRGIEDANKAVLGALGDDAVALGVLDAIASNKPDLIEKVIGDRGANKGEVVAQVQALHASYEEQARNIVGLDSDSWARLAEFCDSDREAGALRAEAVKEFYMNQSTKTLKALVQKFKAVDNDVTRISNDDLEAAVENNARIRSWRTPDGKLHVVTEAGPMSVREAIARGYLKASRG